MSRRQAPFRPLLAGAVLAGCASSQHPSPPSAPSSSTACVLAADSAGRAHTITATFDDSGDARRARLASSLDAPVRIDCEGRPSPALALAWSRDTSGRFWTIELPPVAPGDTGARWTASALAATWRADPDADTALRRAGVQSLVPLDERRLMVGFIEPVPELPTLLADRALGVAPREPRPGLVPSPAGSDLRDAIDGGSDLIETADPDLLDYARRRPDVTAMPLPWSRAYLLLLPTGSAGVGGALPPDTAAFRTALARDVVRIDARASQPPFWWTTPCAGQPAMPSTARQANAIAYPLGERTARDLAERLVALAGDPELVARGLAPDSFVTALRSGAGRAFVVPVPRQATVPCRETAGWPRSASVVALIETRAYAVLRRGAPPLAVEWDGAVRVAQ